MGDDETIEDAPDTVLVEQSDLSVVERPLDKGESDRNYLVKIAGLRYEHCAEDPSGRWIYRRS